jgi:prolyl oligopeptidase
MKKTFLISSLLISNFTFAQIMNTIKYLNTAKDSTVDNYFGTKIADPYRWLENDNSTETKTWVDAENTITQNYLNTIPFKNQVHEELTKMWNYEKYSNPFKQGNYYYFYKNDGLQNQSVLYCQKGLTGTAEEFLNPNTLSKDGTSALGSLSFSKNNKYVGYTISKAGSDWQDIFIMDVATKKLTKDHIQYTKFGGITWQGDAGFYYSGYDKPANEDKKYSAKSEFQKIFYHKIGTDQSSDKLVYEDKEHALRYKTLGLTDDERFKIIDISEGTDGSEVLFWDTKDKTQKEFKTLLPGFDFNYSVIDNIGDKLLVYTNNGASNYQVVLVDPKKPEIGNWKTFIPEQKSKLDGISIVGNQIFAQYLKDASTQVKRFDIKGKYLGEVPSPGIGTMAGFGGKKKDMETFYSFSSFNMPATIYKYDIAKNKITEFKKTKLSFDPSNVVVEQTWFTSKDGTKVPMFLVHKKDIDMKSGNNPVFLYGYGGFNISLTPSFSIPYMYFVQQGGVYAMVNLRGGSEYGEEWHKKGMLENKQNVFDDFIGAAENLIATGVTNKNKLAIHGRSNGGLLVGACMTERPDLFKVALPGNTSKFCVLNMVFC